MTKKSSENLVGKIGNMCMKTTRIFFKKVIKKFRWPTPGTPRLSTAICF